jgi:glycosyltransferase involved in cell wall biosynthesis
MNLLFTLTAYPPYIGGAQLHLHLLAQQLQANHTIHVATFWNHNRTDWLLGTSLNAYSRPYEYTIEGILVHRLGLGWADKLRLAPLATAVLSPHGSGLTPYRPGNCRATGTLSLS